MEYKKYYKERQKVSYDNGKSWQWLDVYRKGGLITTDNWDSKESCERGDEPTPEIKDTCSILYTTNVDEGTGTFMINDKDTGERPMANKTDEQITFYIGSEGLTSLQYFMRNNYNLTNIKFIDGWYTKNVTNMSQFLYNCQYIDNLNLSMFDTSNVKYMYMVFQKCQNLKNINLNNWNTKNVETMMSMFASCESLTELDLSMFETTNVINVNAMFGACFNLERLNLDKFDMSKVVELRDMFLNCNSLNYIKCTQAFKEWCEKNKTTLSLTNFNTIQWDIV